MGGARDITLPVINDAHEVVVLVSGEERPTPWPAPFGPAPDAALPAALVRPRPGRLTLLLDPAASARLAA